jgi:transposase
MYLRTTKRKNKDGSIIEYYQLAHNERDPITKKPIAKIIHSFGRSEELERDQLVRLCNSIARVCGIKVVDPYSKNEDIAIVNGACFPKGLKLIRTVEYGTVLAIEALWERLGIGKTLRDICKHKNLIVPYERALFAMVANRLCEPESKLGVWDRWLPKVYIPTCEGLKLEHMYEAMDLFDENIASIEKSVFNSIANLFNLNVDLIFYDTTTASFSIDQEDEEDQEESVKRKFGRTKEGTWSPQVVIALAVTREGIPVRSWVLPGNTADVTTVKKVKADLRGWNLGRALFVADAGVNSEENREELGRACGKYLLATRMATVSEVKRDVLSKRGRYKVIKDNLMAKEVVIGDGERRRRYILCYNPKEAKRQREHRAQVVENLKKELEKHPTRNATSQWAIELLASKRYRRYLAISKSKKIRIDHTKIREATKYDGKWVLETNDDTISLEDAACGYKGLLVIERCFRSLKRTQIKLCPMFHWTPRRIEAHVRICVLALLIERVAELTLRKPWSRIRYSLEKLQISEFFSLNHRFHRRNELDNETKNILKELNIPSPKHVLSIEKLPEST